MMSAETLRKAAEEIRDDKTPLHAADEPTNEDLAWLAVADWLEQAARLHDCGSTGPLDMPAALAVARAYLREAFRDGPGLSGVAYRRRRVAKVRYWTTTGTPTDRRVLNSLCGWPSLDWKALPPPVPAQAEEVTA